MSLGLVTRQWLPFASATRPHRRLVGLVCLSAIAAALSLVLASCGGGGGSGAAGAATFSKSFGGPGGDEARTAIQTSDGGYVFVGSMNQTCCNGFSDGQLWITKLDANGDVQWQRAIGDRLGSATDRVRRFNIVRATADGGYVVAGIAGYPGFRGRAPSGNDVWVAKFSADGSTEWTHDHDSGAWRGFAYANPTLGRGEFADDEATDIWPTADGGYVVAGRSTADVITDRGTGATAVRAGAQSVIAMRLNAAGEVIWRQRLTEGQFSSAIDAPFTPIVRATADGDAVVGYAGNFDAGHEACVVRLSTSDLPLWRTCEGAPEPWLVYHVTDLVQTHDVNPADGLRDGVRDDGFVVTLDEDRSATRRPESGAERGARHSIVLKLAAGGSVEWRERFGSSDNGVALRAVDQVCTPLAGGGGFDCEIIAGGTRGALGPHGYVVRLSPLGATIAERFFDDDTLGEHVEALRSVDNGQRIAVATRSAERIDDVVRPARRVILDRLGLGVAARTEAFGGAFSEPSGNVAHQLLADASVLVTSVSEQRFDVFGSPSLLADRLDLARTVNLDQLNRGSTALAVAEVAPGSYVVAGNTVAFQGAGPTRDTSAWVLRVTEGQIDWQRKLGGSLDGVMRAMATSGDGGVVVAVDRGGSVLVKLGGDGQVVWRSAELSSDDSSDDFPILVHEVHALPDGGFVAIATDTDGFGFNFDPTVIFRLDSNGSLLWQREYEALVAQSIAAIDDDGDGVHDDGFVIADSGKGLDGVVDALKLDAEGAVIWGRSYSVRGAQGIAYPRKVRQLADGGYVIGFTDQGVIAPDAVGQPFGQSNITLLMLDREGAVVSSRTFGGLHEDALFDLRVLADGGLLVAGESLSLGDGTEAWILRLSADGTIAAGCNADLGSATAAFTSQSFSQSHQLSARGPAPPDPSPVATADTNASASVLETTVARQCFGTANPSKDSGTQLTLTVTQPGTLTGVVTSTPAGIVCGTAAGDAGCSAAFANGSDVLLAVDPGSVSNFLRWEDCSAVLPSETGGPRCRVGMDRDRSVRAIFGAAQDRFRLRVTVLGTGGVRSSEEGGIACGSAFGSTQVCERLYDRFIAGSMLPNGISLSVFANAADFQGWGGDCAALGTAPTGNLAMDADKNCTATFVGAPTSFDLTVQKSGNGGGVVLSAPGGISCGDTCSASFGINQTVRLIANEETDSAFDGWSGCDRLVPPTAGSIPECQVDMRAARTVGAAFTRRPGARNLLEFVVTGTDGRVVSSDSGITCTSSGPDCQELYQPGATVGLRFELLRSGATFQGWGGDCASGGGLERFNLVMNGDKRCTATFSGAPPPPQQFQLTVQKIGFTARVTSTPAGIDCGPNCTAPFNSGQVVSLEVAPGAGFTLSGWTGCDRQVPVPDAALRCEVDLNANRSVQVRVE